MRTRTRFATAALAAVTLLGLGSAVANGQPNHAAQVFLAAPTFQAPSETLYVPITPCRIVDTRAGTGTGGTPYSNLQTRTYYVGGTFGFGPQGGKSGGCGIPVGAVSITTTLLVVSPDHSGRLHAWPNGTTEPTATTYYYANATGSSGTTVTINPATAYSLKVRNYGGPTDLVIDISGYFVKPLAAMIHPNGSLYAGSSRALSSVKVSTGIYRIKFDRPVVNCVVTATAYLSNYYASTDSYSYSATDQIQVEVYNAAGANADQYVYVVATC